MPILIALLHALFFTPQYVPVPFTAAASGTTPTVTSVGANGSYNTLGTGSNAITVNAGGVSGLTTIPSGQGAIVGVAWGSNASTTITVVDSATNTGWTLYGANCADTGGAQNGVAVLYNPNLTTGITSITVSASPTVANGGSGAVLLGVSNLTGSPVDFTQVCTTISSSSTSLSAGPFTSTAAHELIFSCERNGSGNAVSSVAGGYSYVNASPNYIGCAYQGFSTIQTAQSIAYTLSGSSSALPETTGFK